MTRQNGASFNISLFCKTKSIEELVEKRETVKTNKTLDELIHEKETEMEIVEKATMNKNAER